MSRIVGYINWQEYSLAVECCERHQENYVPEFGTGCPKCEEEMAEAFDFDLWLEPTQDAILCLEPKDRAHWRFIYS